MDATRDASGDAALFAFIAARLKGVWSDFNALSEIAQEVGLQLTGRTLRRAPEKAARLTPGDRENWRDLFPNTTHVPLQQLNFFEAAVRLRPADPGNIALAQLSAVVGVAELLRMERDGEVLALVVYETRRDRETLEGEIAEYAEVLEWAMLDAHLREPAVQTWLNLARRAISTERQT